MDRKSQLRNVAFGGDWAEQIEPRERIHWALNAIQKARDQTTDEDLRLDQTLASALNYACERLPKADLIRAAWSKALALPDIGQRQKEIARIGDIIRSAVGNAALSDHL